MLKSPLLMIMFIRPDHLPFITPTTLPWFLTELQCLVLTDYYVKEYLFSIAE